MFKRALLAMSLSGCTVAGAAGGGFAAHATLDGSTTGHAGGAAKTGTVFGVVAGALIGHMIDRCVFIDRCFLD
jgi:hypothetical protein